MNLTEQIKHQALDLGFDIVAVTDASPVPPEHAQFFSQWLDAGCAGEMHYMARNLDKRLDPAKLLEGAKSVIVVGLNYQSSADDTQRQGGGKVALYARYEDYHPFIKTRLHELAHFIKSSAADDMRFKVCVDSAPIAERAIALRAGLGFIGRNHMLINPHLGCRLLIGELVTTLDLEPDTARPGDCGNCSLCIDVCPTGALCADGRFDARKCINYLTIEYKGDIQPDLAAAMGDCLFGCEQCIDVCPYQLNAPACNNRDFEFHPDRAQLDLEHILRMDKESFDAVFADSPIKRAGLQALKGNARICLKNITSRDARNSSRPGKPT